MTSEEAKVLLHSFCADHPTFEDPRLAEAMRLAQRDPDLGAWFERQQALDKAIMSQFEQVSAPAELAHRIMADPRSRAALRGRGPSLIWPIALAASLALLLTMGSLVKWGLSPPASEFAALREDMATFLVTFPRLDLASDQWQPILEWLASNAAPPAVEVPARFQRYPGLGCRTVEWRDRRLLLICFAAQGEIVHLFVLPPGDAPPGMPSSAEPEFRKVEGWTTAAWTQGQVAYLILTKGDRNFLRTLLSSRSG